MDQTRELEFLERASAIYLQYGIKSVTMEDLANQLSISRKTIYGLFNSKKTLINSIIELKVQMHVAVSQNIAQTSNNAIEELLKLSELFSNEHGAFNSSRSRELRKYYPESSKMLCRHKQNFVLPLIKANIDRGIKENIYRANISPDVVARAYMAVIELAFNSQAFPKQKNDLNDVLKELTRLQLYGIVNNSGQQILNQKNTL